MELNSDKMIKDQEYLKKIADICLGKSKKLGSSDANILVQSSVSENVNVRNKKLDGSERSENLGVVLTTYLGKKKSSIASSNKSCWRFLFPLLMYSLTIYNWSHHDLNSS